MMLVDAQPRSAASDRDILRDLARRVRELADDPINDQKRKLWGDHNALRPHRPMVLCFPECGWEELINESHLVCQDPFHRSIELNLRRQIFQRKQIADDNTIEPTYDVGWQIKVGSYGFDVPFLHGENRGSFHWDPPMTDLDRDFAKLRIRDCSVDRAATFAQRDRTAEILGDILPVRIHGGIWWTVGLTQNLAYLFGIEPMMLAMYDQPRELHRLMGFMRDDMLHMIEWCESEGLLSRNDTSGDYVGSGGVGLIDNLFSGESRAVPGPVQLSQRWGFAEAQETVGISAEMFDEFILPYQIPLLEKFGLNCYGCCEGLEHRMGKILRQVPRLRRVSVAPTANQEAMAEQLAGKYIFSRKPQPAHVCIDFNENAIRSDLRRTLACAGGQPLELILKDTHTFEHDATRPGRWVQIAREEADDCRSQC